MRNILSLLLLSVALLFFPDKGFSQSVSIDVKSDSIMLWVGDQTKIHLEVTCDANQHIDFPIYQDTLITGLEIIPPTVTDTQYVNNKKRIIVTRDYTVTSFDSSLYYIPPFQVYVDSVPYYSEGLALSFYMFDVDTLNAEAFYGPKDIMPMPLKWQDLDLAVYSYILFILFLFTSLFLIKRFKYNKPIIRVIKIALKLPPHQRALDMIEQLRKAKRAHDSNPKEYYTELTDIVRSYIKDRFEFDATEMTSSEILERLNESYDKESLSDLKLLLSTADLVKFAKYVPLLGENDQNLVIAMDYVKKTMIEPDPNAPVEKEQEVIVEQKRSKGAGIAILSTIIILSAACITALVVLVRQIYYLFF